MIEIQTFKVRATNNCEMLMVKVKHTNDKMTEVRMYDIVVADTANNRSLRGCVSEVSCHYRANVIQTDILSHARTQKAVTDAKVS